MKVPRPVPHTQIPEIEFLDINLTKQIPEMEFFDINLTKQIPEMEFLNINLTKYYSQSLLLEDFKENHPLLWF